MKNKMTHHVRFFCERGKENSVWPDLCNLELMRFVHRLGPRLGLLSECSCDGFPFFFFNYPKRREAVVTSPPQDNISVSIQDQPHDGSIKTQNEQPRDEINSLLRLSEQSAANPRGKDTCQDFCIPSCVLRSGKSRPALSF